MGTGTRAHDYPPYRAVWPVTEKEYLSRVERYDRDLRKRWGRPGQNEHSKRKFSPCAATGWISTNNWWTQFYKRRGWDQDGVPTLETVRRLGLISPDVVALIKAHGR
jgi:aldehyde:ferredoxin oxidoreductase